MIPLGSQAPRFTLMDSDGALVALESYRGRRVVVYFYPRDDTPGCTLEAREFSAREQAFDAGNAVVLGISTDSVESHCDFARKHGLTVRLLSDPDHAVSQAYGAWQEKLRDGAKVMGVARTTYLLGQSGDVERVWTQVTPQGHAQEVLAAIQATKGT
jgi:peroxiredoxin Q/BCP